MCSTKTPQLMLKARTQLELSCASACSSLAGCRPAVGTKGRRVSLPVLCPYVPETTGRLLPAWLLRHTDDCTHIIYIMHIIAWSPNAGNPLVMPSDNPASTQTPPCLPISLPSMLSIPPLPTLTPDLPLNLHFSHRAPCSHPQLPPHTHRPPRTPNPMHPPPPTTAMHHRSHGHGRGA